MFYAPMLCVPSLYCQESILPGITYVGKTPTTEHDQLDPNVFHQPSYSLHHGHNTKNTNNYY